jgi:diguanylate cyclase (GGDEF)-like protein/PAS domain S-box-containing protein
MNRAGSIVPAAARLRALVDLTGSVLDVASDDKHLVATVVGRLESAAGDPATVWLKPHGGDELVRVGSNHPPALAGDLAAALYCTLDGTPGFEHGEPVVWSADDPAAPSWLRQHGVASVAMAPIRAGDRVLGAIAITRDGDRLPLSGDDVSYLGALGDLSGVAIANARALADTTLVMEALREQNDVMEYMSDALIACDVDRRIVNWNAGAERIYAYTRAEANGCDLFALLATQFFAADGMAVPVEELFAEVAAIGSWRGELRERRADGAPLTMMCSVAARFDHDRQPLGFVLVNRDVTDQRRDEHQAMHDALTGLPNRRMLNRNLYDAFARACRNGSLLAIMFVDLDGFKLVNDKHGHAAGDEVLKTTANRVAGLVRRSDTVSRLDGDEFVVVLEEAGSAANVAVIARRLVETIAEPIKIGQPSVIVRPSIGVVIVEGSDNPQTTPDRLLEASDEAMCVAKRDHLGVWITPA